jgi:hypothetical protein
VGLIGEKTRGRKSRATVPLIEFIVDMIVRYVNRSSHNMKAPPQLRQGAVHEVVLEVSMQKFTNSRIVQEETIEAKQ